MDKKSNGIGLIVKKLSNWSTLYEDVMWLLFILAFGLEAYSAYPGQIGLYYGIKVDNKVTEANVTGQ